MKNKLILAAVAVTAISTSASAQTTIDVAYRMDISYANPVRGAQVVFEPITVANLFTVRNTAIGDLRVVSFAGLRTNNSNFFGGFGLVKDFKLADNISGFIGFQGQFENGRPVSAGLLLGVNVIRF